MANQYETLTYPEKYLGFFPGQYFVYTTLDDFRIAPQAHPTFEPPNLLTAGFPLRFLEAALRFAPEDFLSKTGGVGKKQVMWFCVAMARI